MNEYEIAFITGLCFGGLWIVAYLLCWGCQWAWAWMDDGKMGEENWLASRAIFIKGEYITNDGYYFGLHGYSKDKKHESKSISGMVKGVDYILESECTESLSKEWKYPVYKRIDKSSKHNHSSYCKVGLSSCFIPIISLVAFKIYPVAIAATTLILIAHMARLARRHKKMFDEHIKDKAAH